MTIDYVCRRFVEGKPIRGAYMGASIDGEKEVLSHRWAGTDRGLIAEIVNRKENGDFTLILHPRSGVYKTSHNNRIWGVLLAVGRSDVRYSCHVRYNIWIHDRKLDINYNLERPIKFNYRNGKLLIDYADLESHVTPKEEQKPVVEPSDNNNIKNELARISTILTTV